MTFDDDHIKIVQNGRILQIKTCAEIEVDWPPPRIIVIGVNAYVRTGRSMLTDRQRETLHRVGSRWANYEYHGPFVIQPQELPH